MAFTHDHFGVTSYFPAVSRSDLLFCDTVIAQNGSTMPIEFCIGTDRKQHLSERGY